jgi:hypothetical protein
MRRGAMGKGFRIVSVIVAICVLHLYALPCLGAAAPPAVKKVTTNDPQFLPLSEEQEIKTGVKWYWYVLGAVAIGGIAAVAGGGGGGSSSSSTPASSGTVTGTW